MFYLFLEEFSQNQKLSILVYYRCCFSTPNYAIFIWYFEHTKTRVDFKSKINCYMVSFEVFLVSEYSEKTTF